MADTFSIGDLARVTGTKVNTVRFYEARGLMPRPPRTASGRRIYGAGQIERLQFVRRARALGFGLDEIRSLIALSLDPGGDCAQVSEVARRHLADVERKLADLGLLREELERLTGSCGGGTVQACAILERLGRTKPR